MPRYTIQFMGADHKTRETLVLSWAPRAAAHKFARSLGEFSSEATIPIAIIKVIQPEWGCYELMWWRGRWRVTAVKEQPLRPVTASYWRQHRIAERHQALGGLRDEAITNQPAVV